MGSKPRTRLCGSTKCGALFESQALKHILATVHGHFHNGIRGWDDHGGLHEILFPSILYNLNRGLEVKGAPGYNLPEFRPGYTLVTVEGRKMTLRYKPLGAEVKAIKKLD